MRFWISDFQIFHEFDHDNLDPWIMDNKIMKSPKSRYSPLDRGALTTKVCRHNSCLRSAIFIKMCTEMDQQKIESKSEILDIHDFQWNSMENLGIRGF